MAAPAEPNLGLLWITFAAVAGLVLLLSRYKLNAFLGLLLASIFVGVATGMKPMEIGKAFQEGMGSTLGFIAIVVGLGTMLGRLLGESGGAQVIANRLIEGMGEKRLPWAIMLVALVIGLPVFFGVGVVLLMPIVATLVRQTGRSRLLLGLPLMAGLSVAHGLIPPHPGPLVAVDKLHADIGKTLLWSMLIGLPTAMISGPLFAAWISPRIKSLAPMVDPVSSSASVRTRTPGFGLTLFTILLPVLLMFLATFVQISWPRPGSGGEGCRALRPRLAPLSRTAGGGDADRGAVRVVGLRPPMRFHPGAGAQVHRGFSRPRRGHLSGGRGRGWIQQGVGGGGGGPGGGGLCEESSHLTPPSRLASRRSHSRGGGIRHRGHHARRRPHGSDRRGHSWHQF